MIITRTPFRISFSGGGSDLKDYYLNYGGAVVSSSINKYMFLSIHPYFYKNGYLLKYSKHENALNIDEIQHKIIKQVFTDYAIKGVDFNSSADIPAGTGLASSSAFTSGLINLCNAYTDKYMSKEDIANYACEIEIEKLGEPIGKQDQYACAVGGLNFISFNQDNSVTVEKIFLQKQKRKELQDNLLMFYTGTTRSAGSILKEQKINTSSDKKKIESLHKMVQLAHNLRDELQKGNIDAMGEILDTGWGYKKELASGIANEQIDRYYNLAISNGASGGKLLGAGGGGFLLFYVKQENQDKLRNALSDLNEFKFKFDNVGTDIVYYN
jgi:D-glycero-alpha-D-manno-heptose-7-phosphate kinase